MSTAPAFMESSYLQRHRSLSLKGPQAQGAGLPAEHQDHSGSKAGGEVKQTDLGNLGLVFCHRMLRTVELEKRLSHCLVQLSFSL